MLQALVGLNHEIGFGALVHIRYLAGVDGFEFFERHAFAGQHSGALNIGRRRDHHNRIDPRGAAGFEQERDVEDNDFIAALDGAIQKAAFRLAHQRVDDGLEPLERGLVSREEGRKHCAIHAAVCHDLRESLANRLHCRAVPVVKRVHHGIGIVDRNSQPGEQFGGFCLAHADGPGEPDDEGPDNGGSAPFWLSHGQAP